MQKLHYSIVIDAPKEKVWHAMLDDKQYREWTTGIQPRFVLQRRLEQGIKDALSRAGPRNRPGRRHGKPDR